MVKVGAAPGEMEGNRLRTRTWERRLLKSGGSERRFRVEKWQSMVEFRSKRRATEDHF